LVQTNSHWVELPDCKAIGASDVKLEEDLTNATIATCKAHDAKWVPPELAGAEEKEDAEPAAAAENYKLHKADPIYDPIFHTKNPITAHEHQVVQQAQGQVEPTSGEAGPRGDFYMTGKPLGGEEWPVEHYSPATDAAKPANLVQIFSNEADPSDI